MRIILEKNNHSICIGRVWSLVLYLRYINHIVRLASEEYETRKNTKHLYLYIVANKKMRSPLDTKYCIVKRQNQIECTNKGNDVLDMSTSKTNSIHPLSSGCCYRVPIERNHSPPKQGSFVSLHHF